MDAERTVLADAGNTFGPAVAVLRDWGYSLELHPGDDIDLWFALKADVKLVANDPLRLLALGAIWERFGSDWSGQGSALLDSLYDDEPGE